MVCGRPWFDACHRALDPDVRIDWRVAEGDASRKGTVLATLQGRARALVSAERASLNFLQTLSGTATTTAAYVDAVRGTGARILDTRKTIPGLRLAQKYAVRVGGGVNHRIGLYDAVMLKENHVRAAGSLTAAIRARARDASAAAADRRSRIDRAAGGSVARRLRPHPDRRLRCRPCGARPCASPAAPFNGAIPLEVSGGVDMTTLRAIAEDGVDCISIGGLTKHVRAIDLSLKLGPPPAI